MSNGAAVEPQPYIMNSPLIELDGEVIHCLGSHVELSPDVETIDTPTFCGTKEFPGNVKWYLRLTLYQSFDDDGTDQLLRACRTKGIVTYRFLPYRDRAVSVNNPEFTGSVIVKPYDLINGDVGAASEVTIEWTMTEEPKVGTTPAADEEP